MPIVIAALLVIYLISDGKRSKGMGLREYLVIFLVTCMQILVFLYYIYTLEQPPLY